MENKYAIKKPFIITMADDLRRVGVNSVSDGKDDNRRVASLVKPAKISEEKTLKEKLIGDVVESAPNPTPNLIPSPKKESVPIPSPNKEAIISSGTFAEKTLKEQLIGNDDKSFFEGKKILAIVVAVFILVALGGYYYWQMPAEPSVPSDVPAEFTVIEAEKPATLIDVSMDKVAIVSEGMNPRSAYGGIYDLANTEYLEGSFVRVLVESVLKDESRYVEYRQFSDFNVFINDNLGATFPSAISEAVENFTFFIYSQNDGNRIGVVAKIKEGVSIDAMERELGLWENSSMTKDLAPFLALSDITVNGEEKVSFNDNSYKERNIRYINFDDPLSSIDYAIAKKQNYFIITTSRESMYAVIDKLSDDEKVENRK